MTPGTGGFRRQKDSGDRMISETEGFRKLDDSGDRMIPEQIF